MPIRIDTNEHWMIIATQIFERFDLFQSCCITGTIIVTEEEGEVAKGKKVWEHIIELDHTKNFRFNKKRNKFMRKYRVYKNANRAAIAHKIFKWNIDKNDPTRWTIWRVQ